MLNANTQHIINKIAALSEKTGAAILSYYHDKKSYRIQQKDNHTPLTDADLAAHNILTEGLPKIIPLPCLSEESPPTIHQNPPKDYWLIDPIDGTREFINHSGEFCILIARILNHRPVLSFTYAPTTGEYWFAAKDQGAFKVDAKGKLTHLRCRPVNLEAITVILPKPRFSKKLNRFLSDQFPNYQLITSGSGLKFCALAEGRADIYPKLVSTTSQWDVAAGDLLLEEAGGQLRFSPNQIPFYGISGNSVINPPFLACGAGFSSTQLRQYFQEMLR